MAFLLYYDAGQAADIAENVPDRFWDYLIQGELGETFQKLKRGTERRHFRGAASLNALRKLKSFGMEPWELLHLMYPLQITRDPTYSELYKRMTTDFAGTQFGPYFIWKLYDIFNVCLGMPITLSFDEALKYMPDEPRKAAEYFFGSFHDGLTKVDLNIGQYDHPVRGGKCGLAEAETILCMMKGYFKTKTHSIGDDIFEKYEQLKRYPELQALLPDVIEPVEIAR
jgi:hypothetical protein